MAWGGSPRSHRRYCDHRCYDWLVPDYLNRQWVTTHLLPWLGAAGQLMSLWPSPPLAPRSLERNPCWAIITITALGFANLFKDQDILYCDTCDIGRLRGCRPAPSWGLFVTSRTSWTILLFCEFCPQRSPVRRSTTSNTKLRKGLKSNLEI